jgi:hypothetical protein
MSFTGEQHHDLHRRPPGCDSVAIVEMDEDASLDNHQDR